MSPHFDEVVVRVDEARKVVLIFLATNRQGGSGSDSGRFKLIELPLADLEEKGDLKLGSVMLLALEAVLGRQPNVSSSVRKQAIDQIESRAQGGDPRAQNALGVFYLSESLRLADIHLLDKAETWFGNASSNGYTEATHFLRDEWSFIKMKYANRIKGLS